MLCSLVPGADRHPPEVHELASLLDETGWGDTSNRDPCRTVYIWSDCTEAEHVGDVLFVLGEGDEDKARQVLIARWQEWNEGNRR